MASKTNCVCGRSINRSYSTRTYKAHDGRGSGRVERIFGNTDQLCRSCFREFIQSRPDYEDPSDPGSHTLCDFCNNETSNSLLRIFLKPVIFRWKGKVGRSKGNSRIVCDECRDELSQFIQDKKEETES